MTLTPSLNDTGRAGAAAPKHSRGFAAPDLVLVSGGVAMLIALAIPLISNSREKARIARCTDNLGIVGKALLSQAQDQDGKLPKTSSNPAPGGWWTYKDTLKPFLGAAPATVFACPSDRGYGGGDESPGPFHLSAKHNFTSYVFNGVTLPGIPNISGRSIDSIKNPSKTLLVMEWTAHGPLSWHRSRTGQANAPFYDGAESIVSFVDGHVAMIPFHYDGINAAYTRDPIPGYGYQFSGD